MTVYLDSSPRFASERLIAIAPDVRDRVLIGMAGGPTAVAVRAENADLEADPIAALAQIAGISLGGSAVGLAAAEALNRRRPTVVVSQRERFGDEDYQFARTADTSRPNMPGHYYSSRFSTEEAPFIRSTGSRSASLRRQENHRALLRGGATGAAVAGLGALIGNAFLTDQPQIHTTVGNPDLAVF